MSKVGVQSMEPGRARTRQGNPESISPELEWLFNGVEGFGPVDWNGEPVLGTLRNSGEGSQCHYHELRQWLWRGSGYRAVSIFSAVQLLSALLVFTWHGGWGFHGRSLELIPGNGDSIKVTDLCAVISAVFNSFNAGNTLHQFLQMLTGSSIFIMFSKNVSG